MWYALGLIAVIAGGFWLLYPAESASIEYRFDTVQRGEISLTVTATGTLEAVTTVQVGSQVSGTIKALYADYNTIVQAGDVVAQIDPTFLEAQVKDSEAGVERLKALEEEARRNLDMAKKLYEKDHISQQEYDAKRTALDVATANRRSAEAGLDRARVNLKFATIRAPIDGVVISRNVDVGQTVAASLQAPVLFQIANDLAKMQVKTSIDEADIGKVQTGQEVSFTVDAYPDRRFRGRVSELRLEPIEANSVITYNVIIDVPNEDLSLMPGMTANVTILVERRSDVLKISSRALQFTPPEGAPIADTPQEAAPPEPLDKDTANSIAEAKPAEKGAKKAAKKQPDVQQNPFAGLSREQIREKIQSMSPAERQAMRERFIAMRGERGGWRPGAGGNFEGFNRSELLANSTTESEGKPARQLTEKWERKSSASTSNKFGKVWIQDANGKLRVMPVRLGLSDGIFTEIISEDLKEGDQVLLMAVVTGEKQTDNSALPRGGRGRF